MRISAVADQEEAGDGARAAAAIAAGGWPSAGPGTSARPPAPPRRAGWDGAASSPAGQSPPLLRRMCWLQKTMPQGRLVGRPQSSPLMKLAMRPKNWPIGSQGATRSASSSEVDAVGAREADQRQADADHAAVEAHAAVSRSRRSPRGWRTARRAGAGAQHVEEDVADPPAEDDAERDPQDQVVDLRPVTRRRPRAPELRVAHQAARQ